MKWTEALDRALQRVTEEEVRYVVVAYRQNSGGWDWYAFRYGSLPHNAHRSYHGRVPVPYGAVHAGAVHV